MEAPVPPPVKMKPKAPTRAFTWIHLSDLHFSAGSRERHNRVTAAIARDTLAHRALAHSTHVHLCGYVHGAAATAEKHLGRGTIGALGGRRGAR